MASILDAFDVVIGLEIHAELATKTKVFCGCKNEFGAEPNTNVCPVCLGFPGALPIINKRAVELAIKAGLSFGCRISHYTVFERKNYFYPDLSKAYQISQLVYPLCVGGGITLESGKNIRLNRIHLEEDAGKLTHVSRSVGTFVDYNRGGTPLIEMVTEPDFSSASEVVEFLKRVRETLTFENIANCYMEQGGMRCDVNLSLKRKGSSELGTRTEMKNLNSFKSVERAIVYEAERQAEVLLASEKVIQETRKWNDDKNKSTSMRTKEEAQDYRYFPDPDILPISVTDEDIARVRAEMVMLPSERRERYEREFGLPSYDAKILTTTKYISDYFERCVELISLENSKDFKRLSAKQSPCAKPASTTKCVEIYNAPKKISNWIMVDLLKLVKGEEEFTFPITERDLTTIIKMVDEKQINKTVGLQLFEKVIETGKEPSALAKSMGLLATVSESEIKAILTRIKTENAKVASDYKTNPDKVSAFIVGQVMKATAGKANVALVKKLLEQIF